MESARPYAGVDTRYVYGARCTWHGPISAVGHILSSRVPGARIPCCPHCSGVLYEFPNKETWDNAVATYDAKHEGYAEFTEWVGSIGRCWPNLTDARLAYEKETGKTYVVQA